VAAKASASLASMSGGRLTLGVGVGAREDDFAPMRRSISVAGDDGRGRWTCCGVRGRRGVAAGDLPVGPHPATAGSGADRRHQ
jgi:hypothetical protein